jgi:uncharacterized membrane protein
LNSVNAIPLRSLPDRIRQVLLFEIVGLALMTPLFAWGADEPIMNSVGLMAAMAAVAALWNGLYSSAFDWLEARYAGRRADHRPAIWRSVHAIGFELGLMIATLPFIVFMTRLGWIEALVADLAMALAYAAYAYVFNLAYDRLFPIAAEPAKS